MVSAISVALCILSLGAFQANATPDDGPQYYTDTTVVSGGTTYTEHVPAAVTPYFVSTTSTASTATFESTSATTIYQTFTSYSTSESASTTTWYPTCSGTITVTTTIATTYDYFKVVGTSFVSEDVYETYYISGTSTSSDLATTTTTFYVPGPPDIIISTAPTDIHTAPFSLTFPCATETVTATYSYEPAIVTQVQIRETVATTFSSSESYYTVSSTSWSTQTFVSTILVPHPAETATMTKNTSVTEIDIIIYPQTSTQLVTYFTTVEYGTTKTYHITATNDFTTTILVAVETAGSTFSTMLAPKNVTATSTTVVTAFVPSQTAVLPSQTGGADRSLPTNIFALILAIGTAVVFFL